jgi:aspartate/methionine/tyrosine aminotransferase
MSVFSDSPEFGGLVRFSFCRNRDDLARAVKRLAGWFSSREQKAEVSALGNGA